MENFIKTKCSEISNSFEDVALNGVKHILTFPIDYNKLNPKFAKINITEDDYFIEMFKKLQEYKDLPALYIFKINPLIEYCEIISVIEKVGVEDGLHIPIKNNNKINNNGILYIGKVKKCVWGRLIQHLGYHKNRKSHGLQIDYWSKKLSLPLELTFSVMFFDKKMADYLEVLETVVAKKNKPMIGKH